MKADVSALRIEDHFCGAGGSTTGALWVPDVEVVHAANHSALCIQTHAANYPGVEHSLGDIPSMDPRRTPDADVLITTPECRARSYARGRPKNDPHLFLPGDGLDEQSRATMDEVPRWAEARRYRAVIVENVPQLVDWCEPLETHHKERCNCGATFRRWLKDMTNLGYEHRKVYLNSAFFPPTPQSRDRIYVVFWLRGQRAPDLDHHPVCYCNACGKLTLGWQLPKSHLRQPEPARLAWGPHDTVWGRYGQQYVYVCDTCRLRAVPVITPAATAIEWQRPTVRIGDRRSPLAAGTMKRIQRGLDGLPDRPLVVPLDYLTDPDSRKVRSAVDDVLSTVTAQHRDGLVVQVAGNLGRVKADGSISRAPEASQVHDVDRPLKVVHGSLDRGLVIPYRENARGSTSEDPLPTLTTINSVYALQLPRPNMEGLPTDEPITTGNKLYAVDPWIVTARRNATEATPAGSDPLKTIVSSGNHHFLLTRMIVANYGGPASGDSQQGWARDANGNPIGTITAKDSHAVVEFRGGGKARHVESPISTLTAVQNHALVAQVPDIMDCGFRMLEPSEIGRGMVMHLNAGGEPYVVHGNRRDQVKQYGNAVTPPPMAWLVQQIKESLA